MWDGLSFTYEDGAVPRRWFVGVPLLLPSFEQTESSERDQLPGGTGERRSRDSWVGFVHVQVQRDLSLTAEKKRKPRFLPPKIKKAPKKAFERKACSWAQLSLEPR